MARSPNPYQGANEGVPKFVLATVIKNVTDRDGVPLGFVDVRTLDGMQLSSVPILLPFSSFSHANGDGTRSPGGSGLFSVPNPGDTCLIVLLPGSAMMSQQAYILGFFAPKDPLTEKGQRNRKTIRPGSMSFLSPYGSGFVIHNGGAVEFIADSSTKRTMQGLMVDATGPSQGLIQDLCRNYRLDTMTGSIEMKEMGNGKYGYRLAVQDMSKWSDPVMRAIRGRRYVEIQYGHVEQDEEQISRVEVVGETPEGEKKVCVVTMDGDGNRVVSTDGSTTEQTGGGQVVVTASASGRTVSAPFLSYSVTGVVTWNCPLLVMEGMLRVRGPVVINNGSRPSARLWDIVQKVDGYWRIVQGDPMVLHS